MKRELPRATVRSLEGILRSIEWFHILAGLASSLALVTVVWGIYWLVTSDTAQARVSQLSWEHKTHLRERKVYDDGGWGYPPSGQGYYNEPTFDHDCYQKRDGSICVHHDPKDGHCTASVPDYSRWCDYSYYDWPAIDTLVISGMGHTTSWQTFGPRLNSTHRETRNSVYEVGFVNPDGRSWTYKTTTERDYRRFDVGDYWNLRLPHVGAMEPVGKANLESVQ